MNNPDKDTVYLEVDGKTIDCEEYDTSVAEYTHFLQARAKLKERNFTAILEGDSWCIYYVRVPG